MTLHDAETAEQFDSKKDCQSWINERVVRFKLKMVPHSIDGEMTFVPQKCDGQIISTESEDFKSMATDEPLKHYAEPLKKDDRWMAVMRVR